MASGVNFSEVHRAFDGYLSAAEQTEDDLKAVAHKRARAVHVAAAARLPGRGDTPSATGKTRAALRVVENTAKKLFRVEVGNIPGRDPMVPVYIEFGTVGTPARSFLRKSLDENRDQYLRDVEALAAKRMNRV